MKRSTLIIIISLVVAFIGIGIFVSMRNSEEKEKQNAAIEEYDLYSIIEGDENNGGIGDHIKGTVEGVEPEVYIYEYADYQCPGCATTNPWINEVLESFNGKAAIVYRSFLLSYHQNGRAAASAAEAAGLQDYWKEYANLLFANQSEWEYLSGAGRKEKFVEYFKTVSGGAGDETQFVKDMSSSEVSAKVSFDCALGKRIAVSATPAFYMDGEEIKWVDDESAATKSGFISYFKKLIEKKLGEKTETARAE
ncbi:thioredoxin domain-containing protein [Candidatus Saccharibacteria bacterium]|nr:thioredoxin domain-containing protein [Candidatus Saccharibacteria bacterium]